MEGSRKDLEHSMEQGQGKAEIGELFAGLAP